jgi:hypothetical protein
VPTPIRFGITPKILYREKTGDTEPDADELLRRVKARDTPVRGQDPCVIRDGSEAKGQRAKAKCSSETRAFAGPCGNERNRKH